MRIGCSRAVAGLLSESTQDMDASKVRLLEAQFAAASQKPDKLEPMV